MPTQTVNERLFDHVVRHRVQVLRLGAQVAQDAIDALNDSDDEIYQAIRQRATASGVLTQGRVDRLLQTVRRINDRTYRDINIRLVQVLKALAGYEVDYHRDLISTILPFKWDLTRPKLAFVRAIVDEEPMQGGLVNEWVEGMAQGRYTRVRAAIRQGVAIGETADDIISRIRGRPSLKFKDGVLHTSRRSALTILTTLVNHVSNQAKSTLYAMNEDIISGVQWVATLDNVTCYECGSYHGSVFDVINADLGGKPVVVLDPSLGSGPPLHINCRCALVPVVTDWSDVPDDVPEEYHPQLDGQPANQISYEKWLRRQNRSTQEEILGVERTRMFRIGLPVKKFMDSSGRKLTLPELRKVEAKTLVPKRGSQARRAFRRLPKRLNLGWRPDVPDQRDHLFALAHPEDIALAARISLRSEMPPPFDQSSLGSCTANALVGAMMFAHGPATPMLSRLDLYLKEREIEDSVNEDSGAEIRDGMKALVKWGVCTEATWPYIIRRFKQHPPPQADQEDDQWMATEYLRLSGHPDFMKTLNMRYPFVIGFSVYENFEQDMVTKGGILRMPKISEAVIGAHAVLVSGYETDFYSTQIFKNSGLTKDDVPPFMYEVRNSFGAEWGDGGYYYMPGEYLENRDLSDDSWMIKT